jgi:hypothetical protein
MFISCLLVLWGCTGDGSKSVSATDITALEAEVIKIHDDVMPKMSDIARLMEILEKESGNIVLDSTTHNEIGDAMRLLQEGDSLMWEWMHNYRLPENVTADSLYDYLEGEKQRMTKVRDVMEAGIKNAEQLAQKLGYGNPN